MDCPVTPRQSISLTQETHKACFSQLRRKEKTMADIRPFLCIRPREDEAAEIAALPYDVYNREEAKKAVEGHDKSFLRIDRAETQFDDSVDTYAPEVYKKAHDMLWDMVAEGDFVKEEKPCYYIYELTMDGRVQTGITACASIDDYQNQVIKKHENTRADKEQDRINHVNICDAQTGPIFLAYRSNDVINAVVEKVKKTAPLYDFVAEDGIGHRVYRIVEAEDIAAIEEAFAKIKRNLYRRRSSPCSIRGKGRTDAGEQSIRIMTELRNLTISYPYYSRMTSL